MERAEVVARAKELLGVIVLMDDAETGRVEQRIFRGEWAPDQRARAVRELRKIAEEFERER